MLKKIVESLVLDEDYPKRYREIEIYTRILNGELYDHLPFCYSDEKSGVGGEYIPLSKRRPSVKANFCKLVVDDSVSLLFGSDHFPKISYEDDEQRQLLENLITCYNINKVMIDAATTGSVGSVCLIVKVIDKKLIIEVKNTKYLF